MIIKSKYLSHLSLILFFFVSGTTMAANNDVLPFAENVQKIDDGFYRGKIENSNLWVVMEHIDLEDELQLYDWKKYATIQAEIGRGSTTKLTGGVPFNEGSEFFFNVLKAGDQLRELWIAYITSDEDPKLVVPKFIGYNSSTLIDYVDGNTNEGDTTASNIKMFMTVVTSPNALLTTHMGISTSAEGMVNRIPGLSLYLHSFAAKVMLMENPKRRFMVNAPLPIMEAIILTSLKNVFIDTKKREKNFSDLNDLPFWTLRQSLGKILKKKLSNQEYSNILMKHLPIIDFVPNPDNKYADDMVFYEPTDRAKPWLNIDSWSKTYHWLRMGAPFSPVGITHYVAVDLNELANAKKFEKAS